MLKKISVWWFDRPPFQATVITLLSALFYFLFFPIRYETNDDLFFHLLVSGIGITDTSQETLVFINAAVGWVLVWVSGHLPLIPWYPVFLMTIALASVWACVHIMCMINNQGPWIWALSFTLQFYFVVLLQFTRVAYFASWIGLLGLLLHSAGLILTQRRKLLTVIYMGLAISGFLLRKEAFILALVTLLPFGLFIVYRFRASLSGRLLGAPIVGIVVLLGLSTWINSRWYSSPEWQTYFARQTLRNQLIDYGKFETLPETELMRIGIPTAEARLVNEWLVDEAMLSEAHLHSLLTLVEQNQHYRTWTERIKDFGRAMYATFWTSVSNRLILVWIIVVFFVSGNRIIKLVLLGSLMILFFVLYDQAKLPPRLSVPTSLGFVTVTWVLSSTKDIRVSANTWIASIVVSIFLVGFLSRRLSAIPDRQQYEKWAEDLQTIVTTHKPLYLIGRGSNAFLRLNTFDLNERLFGSRLFPIGWLSDMPLTSRTRTDFNLTREFEKGREIVVVAATPVDSLYAKFLSDRQDTSIVVSERIASLSDSYVLSRIRRLPLNFHQQ